MVGRGGLAFVEIIEEKVIEFRDANNGSECVLNKKTNAG